MDVAVLGAAGIGRGIAQVGALAGHTVRLHDADANVVMDGIDTVERRIDDAFDAGDLSAAKRTDAIAGLEGTTGLEAAVDGVDVLVETDGHETGDIQQRLAEIEALADRETMIATGARTVPVTAAAAGLRHPDRALGLHFRDPLTSALVEVVVADQTTESIVETAVTFVEGLDRHPIIVGDAPGQAAVRLAIAQEVEAMRLVEAGTADVTAVDEALTVGYDAPAGPLERADRAGLDDRLATLEVLADTFGDRFAPPTVLRERVTADHTGTAAGEGFYVWEGDEPVEPALSGPGSARRRAGPDDAAR